MFSLQNRVAVVTGASQGIGQGIAEVFAEAGARVVIAARNAERGERVASNIISAGGEAVFVKSDISSVEGVDALIATVLERYGKIDVLVHNAGVFPMVTVDDLTEDQLEETFSVNLKAAFRLTKAVAPSMRGSGGGRLLFTGSVTGPRVAMPLLAHYAASKAGLNGFIRAASLEYARDGITINAVEPGFVLTQAMDELVSREEQKQMAMQIPMGRLGAARDIGYAMLYLASDEAGYVTGQSIVVDGGSCTPESGVQLQAFYDSRTSQ
ncbi:MAG TPA: SDR family oxidoreductase [Paraburkholderia sp.]|uniref:SDR family oxidoreductase n=1 Tax=Paraburkholderia sp. TaxID=1926495 RepID=UPI002B45B324|nr:SDR family oxidoreductase [Paraburkholderia sp.]HKR40428.1 SDR family oxidoreductase [Paraburkholderia sp.]